MERTNYFFGQVLGLSDLQREQQYLLQRLRHHNRFAHGWGVLNGLQVAIDGAQVVVKPGVAIDCEGNELHLVDEQRLPLPNVTAAEADPVYIGVRFTETLGGAPIPTEGEPQYGVVVEGAVAELSATSAAAGHSRQGPGTPGCGQRHALVLARARWHKGHWQLRRMKSSA